MNAMFTNTAVMISMTLYHHVTLIAKKIKVAEL